MKNGKKLTVKDCSSEEFVNTDYFYRIKHSAYDGFILREGFERGNYRAVCTDEMTNGNGWSYDYPNAESLVSVLTHLLEHTNFKIYVYSTEVSFFNALARAIRARKGRD